jgi:hypothetical protein
MKKTPERPEVTLETCPKAVKRQRAGAKSFADFGLRILDFGLEGWACSPRFQSKIRNPKSKIDRDDCQMILPCFLPPRGGLT